MKSKKYGNYYGELIKFKIKNDEVIPDNIKYHCFNNTTEFIKSLFNCGCTEVVLDVDDDNDYSSTLFFETDDKTNFQELMVIIVPMRPDEFSEETPNHFRMWFD